MSWQRLRALVGWGLLERLHEVNTAILAPGEELKEKTIEKLLAKSDLEIGLEYFLGVAAGKCNYCCAST